MQFPSELPGSEASARSRELPKKTGANPTNFCGRWQPLPRTACDERHAAAPCGARSSARAAASPAVHFNSARRPLRAPPARAAAALAPRLGGGHAPLAAVVQGGLGGVDHRLLLRPELPGAHQARADHRPRVQGARAPVQHDDGRAALAGVPRRVRGARRVPARPGGRRRGVAARPEPQQVAAHGRVGVDPHGAHVDADAVHRAEARRRGVRRHHRRRRRLPSRLLLRQHRAAQQRVRAPAATTALTSTSTSLTSAAASTTSTSPGRGTPTGPSSRTAASSSTAPSATASPPSSGPPTATRRAARRRSSSPKTTSTRRGASR